MSACRLCGREVTGTVCPACGTPVGESVPWAPLAPPSAARPPAPTGPHAQPPLTPADSYLPPYDPYVPPVDAYAQPADPYGQPYDPYGQPADPYAQPAAPYAPPTDPYGRPADPYAQPAGAHGLPPYDPYAQPGPAQPGQGYGQPAPGYPPQAGLAYLPEPRPRRPWLPWVAALLAVALVIVAVLVGQRFLGGGTPTRTVPPTVEVSTATARPTTPAVTTSAPPTTPATTPPATEDQALAALRQGASAGLPQLNAAVSARSWVAQLSSKSVGITDPLQTAANGTHVFFALDILAEHNQLLAKVRDASVILAESTTYGSRKTDTGARPYWRTLALSPAFTSEAAVTAWCARTFAPMTGAELENQCVATQL